MGVGLKAALKIAKEKILSFFEKHKGAEQEGFDEEAFQKLAAEKEKTAESLRALSEKEKELFRAFEEARRDSEKELSAERLMEKELFALQVRGNELRTQMQLFSYKEEHQ